jgi:hypothetical protein
MPRRDGELTRVDDDPAGAGVGAAEAVDRVRVDEDVRAGDDPVPPRDELVPGHVERAARRERAGGADPRQTRAEHLVAGDAAGVEVERGAAEVDAAVEAEHDVVLDPDPGAVHPDPVRGGDADAGAGDEDVALRRDEELDAGELDRGPARVGRAVREHDEVLERRDRHVAEPDGARGRAPAHDREALDGHGDGRGDRERLAARDEDRRGPLPAEANRAGAVDLDPGPDVVEARGEADGAARLLHRLDRVLDRQRAR